MKPRRTFFSRIKHAIFYSRDGLAAAITHEAAFRQELLLFFLLLPAVLLIPFSHSIKIVLLIVNSLVLIVELLNSAVEAVVDMVSPEFHELAKKAKDMGSAAVFLSLVLCAATWIFALSTLAY